MEIKILKPSECSRDEIDKFCKLVEMGEQVPADGLHDRVTSAHLLGFAYEENELAAVAAIKNPSVHYRNRVFQKAGVEKLAAQYLFEVGYAFTLKEYRGKGLHQALLKELLTATSANCYSTTKADNVPYILVKMKFIKTGDNYYNENGETLQLFTYNI